MFLIPTNVCSFTDEPGVPAWVTDTLLPNALQTINQSISGFWPDGGWQEGPNYAGVPQQFSAATVK